MWGFGDCLFGRAVLRELLKVGPVQLESNYRAIYHDLVSAGLELFAGTHGPRIREEGLIPVPMSPRQRGHDLGPRIGYLAQSIMQKGSILAAQFASVGLDMPARPDFSLPIPEAWWDSAEKLMAGWDRRGKPLMIYRPIVLNRKWEAPARSPDPDAYAAIYRSIREKFFVVSVANLKEDRLVGGRSRVDVRLEHDEIGCETLAALFAAADLVFANPGYAPVLAQAVGTPVVIIYGANESHRTTNAVGDHLAPTLAIEPDRPCEHHLRNCSCSKHITLAPALERLQAFVQEIDQPRVLIFGTAYMDTPQRAALTTLWRRLHGVLNPECDRLLVDSASPIRDGFDDLSPRERVFDFGDNIGHLSRNGPNGPASRGQDGWGRAFCHGLQTAIDDGYDYVAHIESDSLFRLPLAPIVRQMRRDGIKVASVPVEGTRRKEIGWVETGLIIFSVAWLRESGFLANYDWRDRRKLYPTTPEKVIFDIIGPDLTMMPWRAERGDKSHITADNVAALDWVTHCRSSDGLDDVSLYQRYAKAALTANTAPVDPVCINLGCGTNALPGWQNHDADIDIAKPLPFADNSADAIFAEHVVEHVDYYAALRFFAECRRVLRPDGVIRICVPSIENIWKRADAEYFRFVRRWAPTDDMRGALHAILHAHGHKAAWTESRLAASLFYAGFDNITPCELGHSSHVFLRGIEGHSKIIGERMNWIESTVCEGTA